MKTQVKLITPEWARKVLETQNTNNRPISKGRVASLVSDMKSGAFMLTHQGIAFDEGGNLIDGQHRLSAIVEHGSPVRMMVTTGLQSEQRNGIVLHVMDTIDRGGARGVGQQLTLSHGYKNGNIVAAGARMIFSIAVNNYGKRISTAQTLHILKMYGEHLEAILSIPWQANLRRAPIYGTLAFCRPVSPDKVDAFAEKLATMENIPLKSPVMALHRWNNNHGRAGNSSNSMNFSRVVASCVHKYIDGKTLEKTYGSDESLEFFRNQQKQSVRILTELDVSR